MNAKINRGEAEVVRNMLARAQARAEQDLAEAKKQGDCGFGRGSAVGRMTAYEEAVYLIDTVLLGAPRAAEQEMVS